MVLMNERSLPKGEYEKRTMPGIVIWELYGFSGCILQRVYVRIKLVHGIDFSKSKVLENGEETRIAVAL